mmetsp:Transcript_72813/g.236540  ORF Transcript_72813/g.236540 Transcript_72813/m.236540 type:complete len:199 (+) Transcript_72813:131-727(+)
MHEHSLGLLLRACGSCLSEVAALRQEVRSSLAASSSGYVPPTEVEEPDIKLETLCIVQDPFLRCFLVETLEESGGAAGVELEVLARRWAARAKDEDDDGEQEDLLRLLVLLVSEFRRGGVKVTALSTGEARGGESSVEALLTYVLKPSAASGGSGSRPKVVIWPVFEKLCWPLIDALVSQFEYQRLTPPLDLLSEALA